ncbi:MAG: methyl-accepting chemotaxis protein [Maritimibacter sp.]
MRLFHRVAQALENLPIRVKLPVFMVVLLALVVSLTNVIFFLDKRNGLIETGEAMVNAIADTRATALEKHFQDAANDIQVLASEATTVKNLEAFTRAWSLMGEEGASDLHAAYVTQNPHDLGQRQLLDEAQGGAVWAYSANHSVINPRMRDYMSIYGYYDVMLISAAGNVVYSAFKNEDFATNVVDGPFSDTGLGRVFSRAMEAGAETQVFEDLAPYEAGFGDPATFIAQAVSNKSGDVIGVLVFRLMAEHVSEITNSASGLGHTGEIYVIGPDGLMRTNSRFDPVPSLLAPGPEMPLLSAGLAGEAGYELSTGKDHEPALIAYRPVNVLGQNWVLVAEFKQSEVLAETNVLIRKIAAEGLVTMIIVLSVALLFSRSIVRPLGRVSAAMRGISNGNLDTEVVDAERGDEVGSIAKTLENFRFELREAEKRNFESHFRGAAFENSQAAIMMADDELSLLHVNDALLSIFKRYQDVFAKMVPDCSAPALEGRKMPEFFPPLMRDELKAILADSSKLPYRADLGFGDVRLTLDISLVTNESGKPLGYVAEWSDVTEGYMNSAMMKAIDANQVKAEFTPDGLFLRANSLFFDAIGGESGFDPQAYSVAGLHQDIKKAFETVQSGRADYGQFVVPHSSGDLARIDGGFAPVTDANGKVLRVVLMGKDVTEAHRAMSESEAQRRAMKDAQDHVVDALRSGLGSLAQGDLTARLDEAFSQDYEQLRVDFNSAVEGLLAAMRGVVENADLITGEAAEISSAADDLSQRTERQAATLEETASALDEMTSSVKSAAEGALHANEIVENARRNAEASGEIVREAVEAMSEIESSSTQISKITGVIDDIAFQTNLLALNAGVEAARAGEAGRGFAVVASEVRALAQRSSDAAREINELISASGAQVKRGVDLVDQAGGALKGIVESVSEISQNVSDIAVSSQEQSAGLAEINSAMNQLDQVTQQNAAMFEETTAASHALTREAETLAKTMAQFKTGTGTRPGTGTGAGKSAQVVDAASFASRREAAAPSPAKPTPPAPTAQSVASAPASATAQALDIEDDDGGWDEF